jgi:Spy/CpxP family protein refolding chaperone
VDDKMKKGSILALVVTGFFFTSRPGLSAEAGTGVRQVSPGMPVPTLETEPRRLEDLLDRVKLTHAQRERVEQIMEGEAVQLQLARGNPNLSVARVFAQEQAIRIQTRRQISAILTAKQTQELTELILHRRVKLENQIEDY